MKRRAFRTHFGWLPNEKKVKQVQKKGASPMIWDNPKLTLRPKINS